MIFFCLVGFIPALAQNSAEDVQEFTLKNGMKFLVLEDHSIPNANLYLFWKVGSRNEYPGITGISHFFEHMMFNGAKKYGPKMFDRTMEAAGGSNNAYTSENVTVYTDWFPGNALEMIFDLEADRIANLSFDSVMVESERGVILSERITSLENSNFSFLNEYVKGAAFHAHSYRWPIIGYESDIRNWTITDLQNYFETYYAPNNAVAVVVGDVKLEQVKDLAEKYFAPIPNQEPPRKIHTIEPPQLGEKRLVVHKKVSSPNLMLAYHVPESNHADYYALELLQNILTEGNSSRLYRRLVEEKQLATTVFTYSPFSFDPNLFYIYSVATGDVDAEAMEQEIYQVLHEISEDGITADELQKAKNQKLMNLYQELETINGTADNLGTYELFFGDYQKLYTAPQSYEKVTVDDIRRVVNTYFKAENRTVGILKTPTENQVQ
jgi:predicted Zn-dependent peptidase